MTLLSSNPQSHGQDQLQQPSSSSATPDHHQATPSTTNTFSSDTHDSNRPRPRQNSPPISGERGAFNARAVVPCDHSELDPGDEEAARCLHNYQTYMAKYFPFVVIPPDVTVTTLRDTKPFLFKAIVVVASVQDLARQRAMGFALMSELTTKLFIQGQRSVDLLQGILVWLAWYVLLSSCATNNCAHPVDLRCASRFS